MSIQFPQSPASIPPGTQDPDAPKKMGFADRLRKLFSKGVSDKKALGLWEGIKGFLKGKKANASPQDLVARNVNAAAMSTLQLGSSAAERGKSISSSYQDLPAHYQKTPTDVTKGGADMDLDEEFTTPRSEGDEVASGDAGKAAEESGSVSSKGNLSAIEIGMQAWSKLPSDLNQPITMSTEQNANEAFDKLPSALKEYRNPAILTEVEAQKFLEESPDKKCVIYSKGNDLFISLKENDEIRHSKITVQKENCLADDRAFSDLKALVEFFSGISSGEVQHFGSDDGGKGKYASTGGVANGSVVYDKGFPEASKTEGDPDGSKKSVE